jgi:NTE family protein
MSSGFFGFFAHCGVMIALEDAGLLPRRVCGSSAGALVTGAWASGLDAMALRTELLGLRREDFWDPTPGLGLLRGKLFREKLERLLPSSLFGGCRVPVSVSAFDVRRRKTVVLDRGDLASAIHASCAVPLMFHPVWIGGVAYFDGGVADRPGIMSLAPRERTLFHHLSSRSPWRRPGSPSMEIPRRPAMVTVVIDDLPRLGPFALEAAPRALERARTMMREALRRPVVSEVVHVG